MLFGKNFRALTGKSWHKLNAELSVNIDAFGYDFK